MLSDRLPQQSHDADVIVVGRVAGILRYGHNPINSLNMHQHTVYVVAVEDYLKRDASGMPAIIKVRQHGGPLPWQEEVLKEQGEGWQLLDSPLLNVGDRYILFLRLPANSDSSFRKLGYVPVTDNGITGKIGELDEYIAAHHWQGKILLREGFTRAPAEKGGDIHWRFERGPQILDIPEGEAIELLRRQLSRPSP